ncbi:MAG: hypothetical protein LC105_08320 [Chitinophagales bacterium]|nr:hypothetical protein [Chitinophagales bacterium]MCZ2393844.1 hypothetical protein [Chitinophagales bacterium]
MKTILMLLLVAFSSYCYAQNDVLEKSYDISRKAKRGYLGGTEVNEKDMTFDMIYVLPSSDRKVKIETYTFNKEMDLINTVKDEWDIEKVRTRYKWFNFRGDTYQTNALTASTTMAGKLIFRKKLITYKYRWWYGQYVKSIKMLEKVKPRNDAGEKYFFRGGAYEVDRDSSILVFGGRQDSPKDILGSYLHYDLLKSDNNVNISVMTSIDFPAPYAPIFAEPLRDENDALSNDDLPRDWIVVFAPQGGIDKKAKISPTQYIYFRITPEGKIVEKVEFEAPSNGWRILEAYEKNNSVFIYGPTITKDPTTKYINQVYKTGLIATTSADEEEKAAANSSAASGGMFGGIKSMVNTFSGNTDYGITQEAIDDMLDALNFNGFALGEVSNGQLKFAKETPVSDFNSKAVKPSDQKDIVKFDGKKFSTYGIYFAANGDILINGQDFKLTKSKPFGVGQPAGTKLYKGVYLFQFDHQGNLKNNYGIFIDQKKTAGFFSQSPLTSDMFPVSGIMTESQDKSKLYWLINICRSIQKETDIDLDFFSKTTTTTWTPLYSVQYGTIDLNKGTISDFKLLGEAENKKFYLFPSNNVLRLGQYIVYLSETGKGDKLLLSRMDISK